MRSLYDMMPLIYYINIFGDYPYFSKNVFSFSIFFLEFPESQNSKGKGEATSLIPPYYLPQLSGRLLQRDQLSIYLAAGLEPGALDFEEIVFSL